MIKITTLALALSLSFFSGLSSGHATKYEFHNLGVNAVAQDGDDSQGGCNGSQGGNGSKGGNGSQGGNGGKVKGQGDTLPNTATHYPAAILMGITTFLFGITLFVRRKKVK
ncbi:LPXTG cell wall anchor domain-containing protein [Bacillus sp. Xin]|nr:LPXTG cell wall anchor domain-containing protein [Bacillus sp. Xin]NSW36982.1 LPXTG cell wall anchor domain-containing protein [Bacillus sp. Xin1]